LLGSGTRAAAYAVPSAERAAAARSAVSVSISLCCQPQFSAERSRSADALCQDGGRSGITETAVTSSAEVVTVKDETPRTANAPSGPSTTTVTGTIGSTVRSPSTGSPRSVAEAASSRSFTRTLPSRVK
jgi:hypothetical protein